MLNHARLRVCALAVIAGVAALSLRVEARAARTGAAATPPTVGVLIVAHGADAAWNAPVESLAVAVARRGVVRGPVAVAFLMGDAARTHRFQDQVADLSRRGASTVVVVPLLVSSHSGHFDQLRYLAGTLDTLEGEMAQHLAMAGIARVTATPMAVARAFDDARELAHVLSERAKALAPTDREQRALFLFGHGPNSAEDYALWMKNLRAVADSVRRMAGFASVAVELVRDDAPPVVRAEAVRRAREIVELQHAATGRDVVVVPILVSAGDISRRKLPADLGGLPVVYAGTPLLPDSAWPAWVERSAAEAALVTEMHR